MRPRTIIALLASVGLALATAGCVSTSTSGLSRGYYDRGGSIHADSFPANYGARVGYYGRPYRYY